jgi:hypothetical protein
MMGRRRWQILALVAMALVGIGLGAWLFHAGLVRLGCAWIGLFLWRLQQFAGWFVAPQTAPSDASQPINSKWQRFLLSSICLLGAGICGLGVYLWWWWPEQWQVGLIFILSGLAVLAPVTIQEIRFRRKLMSHFHPPAAP